LSEQRSRMLGVFARTRFTEVNPVPERELRGRLVDILLTGREPTEEEALLIGLLEPLGLIDRVVPKENRRTARKRAKEIAEYGLAGTAVRVSVREVQAAVMAAAIASTVAASSGGSS
jgi:enoyl-CoA hydratase/carnithine racemase